MYQPAFTFTLHRKIANVFIIQLSAVIDIVSGSHTGAKLCIVQVRAMQAIRSGARGQTEKRLVIRSAPCGFKFLPGVLSIFSCVVTDC